MEKYIGQLVQLIYLDRKRQVSIRDIRVVSVKGEKVKAFCYSAQAIRIFSLNGIVDFELAKGERHGRSSSAC